MKHFLSSLLAIVLLLAGLSSASASALRYNSFDRKTALEQFEACAFSAEYGGEGRDFIVRWEQPISIYFSGDYTNDDLAFFFRFLTELTEKVEGLPEIRLTTDQSESNVQIYYTTLDQMGDYISSYTEGNWGYFTFWYTNNVITELQIAVATDVTNQYQRNHIIMEEFAGGLGLAYDHYIDEDSILYGVWTETQTLTDADWLMIQFLYDERFSVGQTWNELKRPLEKYY